MPADVVLAPRHARPLLVARQARRRLEEADVAVPAVDLGRYDTAVEIQP